MGAAFATGKRREHEVGPLEQLVGQALNCRTNEGRLEGAKAPNREMSEGDERTESPNRAEAVHTRKEPGTQNPGCMASNSLPPNTNRCYTK